MIGSEATYLIEYVCINDCASSKRPIKHGVPQGSILGPLLFILYINDLENASELLYKVIFADDTILFMSNKDPSVLQTELAC